MGNLATNLQETARQYPLYPALRGDGGVLSFADLDDLSARVAGGLHAHGVRPGDRVGLMAAHGPVHAVLYYGVLRIGAVAVLLAFDQEPADARRHLDASGARLVFSGVDLAADDGPQITVGRDFLGQAALWPLRTDIVYRDDEDTAVLRYDEEADRTFAVFLTHGVLRAQAYTSATSELDLNPGDVLIGCPPTAVSGGVCSLDATVLAGACLLIPDAEALAAGEGDPHARTCTGTSHTKGL